MESKADKLSLAGVFGLVAPLAATLGLFKATGSIGRIQRDQPYWLWLAITLVLLAGAMLTIATFRSGEGSTARSRKWIKVLFIATTACTAIGFVIALGLVFFNASAEPRPAITASLNGPQSKLTAHVTASNLKTDHRLAVKVDLATLEPGKTVDNLHPFAKLGSLPLERVYVGPNPNGDIDQRLTVSIPRGGSYTDIVIKAFTGERNSSCTALSEATPDSGTACTFIALDSTHGGS
jgi:hypothetical protein